jgi:hypothetical protein
MLILKYSCTNLKIKMNLLQLLYCDRLKFDVLEIKRKCPTICYWTSEKVRYREYFEQEEIGEFGLGDLNDKVFEQGKVESDSDESDSDDSDGDGDEDVDKHKSIEVNFLNSIYSY